MTHTEAAEYMGKVGTVAYDGMEFRVQVLDVRELWGKPQVLVAPDNGLTGFYGSAWKDTTSVRFA